MFTGGDEFLRTPNGNNNPYNLDNRRTTSTGDLIDTNKNHFDFARRMIAFRRAHPALRPADTSTVRTTTATGSRTSPGIRDDGNEAGRRLLRRTQDRHFLAYRIDGTEFGDPALSIYVGYNGWQDPVNITLPSPSAGHAWFRAGDTAAWMENDGNFRDAGREDRLTDRNYTMDRRSVLVLIEK